MTTRKRDYYLALGISKTASQEEIRYAYLEKVRLYHPDRNPGDEEAGDKFRVISEAYDVLQNPKKRMLYDQGLDPSFHDDDSEDHFNRGPFSEFTQTFNNIFKDFFKRNTSKQQHTSDHRHDIEKRIVLSIKEVITGLDTVIEAPYMDTCKTCKGTRTSSNDMPETCLYCHGQGVITRRVIMMVVQHACDKCNGMGYIIHNPCSECQGKGVTRQHKKLKVSIPPGVSDGDVIKIQNVDRDESSFIRHLYLYVHVTGNDKFSIKNNRLYSTQDVSMLDLILGGTMIVDTPISSEKVTIEIQPGTEPFSTISVSGYGLPSSQNRKNRNALHVTLRPVLPKSLSKKHLQMLQFIQNDLKSK